MGQYWKPVNLTKREYIDPHKLGAGLKLAEQVCTFPGTGTALLILTAAMPQRRGGGDLDLAENWHGPERGDFESGPAEMPADYPDVARRTIGRWAGDRIVLVGDYAEADDLPDVDVSDIYVQCDPDHPDSFTDVSDDVARVIEHEVRGKYTGDGWRRFESTW